MIGVFCSVCVLLAVFTVWEMFCRAPPYAGLTHGEIIYRKVNQNEHPPIPDWLPQPVADLMLSCWAQV